MKQHNINDKNDRRECLFSTSQLVLEVFKVSMACFLGIFVPQRCDDNVCSMSDLTNFDDTNRLVMFIINCVAFFLFGFAYIIEQNREAFIIDTFNIDHNICDTNLKSVTNHKHVFQILQRKNKLFFNVTKGVGFYALFNTIVSIIFLVPYIKDTSSVTSLLSYIAVVATTLYTNYTISSKSYKQRLALSTIQLEPVSYNSIEIN